MRLRAILLGCVVGLAASAVVADSASAIEIGPVSLPPTVTVTVPPKVAVGPVVVEPPKVLPKASVNTSPTNGVGVDVSLPPVLGPVLPGLPNSVHVGIGPNGVALGAPASLVPGSEPGPGVAAPTSPTKVAPRSPASSVAPLPRVPRPSVSTPGVASGPTAGDHNVGAAASAPGEDTSDAVNASLRLQQPNRGWDLWRAAASARGLWIALLLIVLAASWIVHGFLRDALKRSRAVKPV